MDEENMLNMTRMGYCKRLEDWTEAGKSWGIIGFSNGLSRRAVAFVLAIVGFALWLTEPPSYQSNE